MLDKETYTREEVEDIVHKVRCDMLTEERIRINKVLEDQKARIDVALQFVAIPPAGTAKGA